MFKNSVPNENMLYMSIVTMSPNLNGVKVVIDEVRICLSRHAVSKMHKV